MEREVLFLVLALASFGAVLWGAAAYTRTAAGPEPSEPRAWRRLVRPVLVGGLFFAFLVGWVLQEADPSDEWVNGAWHVLAGLTGVVVLRASWRGLRSLCSAQTAQLPIATIGLLRCRVLMSEEFRRNARRDVLAAALAHEAAHARGRDPLRILIAQGIADLQWPVPGVRRRFKAWLLALELRRDDEAIEAGACPLGLAEGILLAARLGDGKAGGLPIASIDGDGASLALRVRRLLRDGRGAAAPATARGHWGALLYFSLVVASASTGLLYGEVVLGLIPGVGR